MTVERRCEDSIELTWGDGERTASVQVLRPERLGCGMRLGDRRGHGCGRVPGARMGRGGPRGWIMREGQGGSGEDREFYPQSNGKPIEFGVLNRIMWE